MATEILIAQCHPGRLPDDANSESGQALKDSLNELSQQDGFQRLYWGREVENPDVLRMFVDWDSVESHQKFIDSQAYGPFCERLGFVIDLSKLQLYHVPFAPHPPSASLSDTSAPVTEIITCYFPTSYSSSDQETFESGFKKLVAAIENNAKTYRASAGGWVKEEIKNPESGETSKAYVGLIAWDSVQAHLDFRNTEPFKENIHHLRGAKDMKHLNVVHSSCIEIGKGGVGDDFDQSVQDEVLNPQKGGKQSVKTRADGTTTKNDGGTTNAVKKERQGRGQDDFA